MRHRILLLASVGLGLTAASSSADTLYQTSGPTLFNVRITKVENGKLYFQNSAGALAARDLGAIVRISAEAEPALTEAESAFTPADSGPSDIGKAIDGWQRALRSSPQPWARDWSARRLSANGTKIGRIDVAVAGYLALLDLDEPAAAPALTAAAPPNLLDVAANQIEQALATRNWSDDRQIAALSLLLDIRRKSGSTAQTAAVIERLAAKGITTSAAGTQTASAELDGLVNRILAEAAAALARQDYAQAIRTIDQNRERFTRPRHQAEALFTLAAATEASADGDKSRLKRAALDYMRLVANFTESPEAQARIAPSLLGTGRILATLGQADEARRVLIPLTHSPDPAISGPAATLLAGLH